MSVQTSVLSRMNIVVKIATVLLFAIVTGTAVNAGEVFKKRSWGAAVNGYDVVSYHNADAPVKGSKEFTTTYLGETWQFASQANLDLFVENPDQYRPAYGGHCAWAMSKGKKAPGNPTVYHVVDGVLYLNVSKGIQKRWFKDIPGFIEKADAEWPAVSAKLNS